MAHDANQEICLQHGGILPEPRSQEENDFLNSLNTNMFLLGLRDVVTDGSWLWDSDGTPVLYTNWRPDQPDGGNRENCAFVNMDRKNLGPVWDDFLCVSRRYLDDRNNSLICQKNKGVWVIFFIKVGPFKIV